MVARTASALAGLTFGLPMLAWGALAVAGPVIIHLVLRQRPRRETLPTLRFLLKAHQSATRAHRLKYLLLLLARMCAILLVVGLLMKTGCAPSDARPTGASAPLDGPVSAILAIDDSASMQYRYQGRTRLEDAQTWTRNLIADVDRFPPGSELAVVAGSTNTFQAAGWSRDARAATRQVTDLEAGYHDRPVAALLRQAYGLLATAGHPRKEIYLLTDLTESSLAEPLPEWPKELANVFILDVGRDENHNLALGLPDVPRATLSTNQPSAVRVNVRAGDPAAPASVTLSIDGQPRDRRAVAFPGANSEVTLSFTLAPLTEGVHELQLELEPDDALSFDNRRFACVAVGRVAGVVVVGGEGGGSVASMITAMIAPPALPAEEQRFLLQHLTASELATAKLEPALAVILADPPGLTPGGWQTLERYVAAGGTLLLIPGPNITVEAYAGQDRLLPAEIKGIATPTEPITIASADLTAPYLKPFADPEVDSLNDRLVFRHLDLGPLRPDARIVAPFSDHTPAIIERPTGRGRVLQFAFSTDRDWGQLGTQAGPTIVLLHSFLESLAPHPDNVEIVTAGRLAIHRWASPAQEYILREAETSSPLAVTGDSSTLPNSRPGMYRVTAGTGQGPPALVYAANVAEGESDLARLPAKTVTARFPAGAAVVVRDPADLPSRRASSDGAVSWTVPLALALLALLWIETLFSNRFYGLKKPSATTTTAKQ